MLSRHRLLPKCGLFETVSIWSYNPRRIPLHTFIKVVIRAVAVLLSATVCFIAPASGLERGKNIDQYGHNIWTSQNGLPGEAVYQILQSPDGYLWLRTSAGLVRFDGVRFVLIDPVVGDHAVGEPVRAICLGADGDLLIRTTSRTILYKRGVFTDYRPPAPLPDGDIRVLFESKQHDVFIGSDDFIYLLNGDEVRMLQKGTGWVFDILEDSQGKVWFGSASALYTYSHGVISQFGALRLFALKSDDQHTLWAGTSNGLFRMKRDERSLQPAPGQVIRGEVNTILEDRTGNMWLGTSASGLVRADGGAGSVFSAHDGLSDNKVLSLYEDREGGLWVGTSSGLDRFRDVKITTITAKEGLPSNQTDTAVESRDGSVYIFCGGGGLARIKDGVVSALTLKDGLISLYGNALFESRDGSFWIGTVGGLTRYKDGRLTVHKAHGRLSKYFISAISEDSEGLIVTTSETLALRYKDDEVYPLTFQGRTTPLSKPGNYTFAMYADSAGTLWFGTVKGLFKFAMGESPEKSQQSQVGFPVTSISEDQHGNLWLGGRIPGITRFRMRDGHVTRYTSKEGLFDTYPTRVLPADDGNLWISTPNGLYEANGNDLEDFAAGRVSTVRTTIYGAADGMKTGQASATGAQPGGTRTQDGRLWFTTPKGISVVDPKHIPHNRLIPPVIIEEIIVNGGLLPSGKDFEVGPSRDKLEFHYTSLSFLVPARVRFRYKLEGYDLDWVDAKSRRVAYYTNLPPGKYRFRVIGSNDDGVWNETGASVGFILKPQFYETGWFYTLGIVTLTLLGMGAQRFYTRRMRARATELEAGVQARTADLAQANQALQAASAAKSEFLANMSHEIRTPLNGIVGMTELALETDLTIDQKEYLDTVKLSADLLLNVINDVLDFSKIEARKIDLECITFDLREVLRGTLKTLSLRASEKGLNLLCEVEPEVPETVCGDANRLRQVLTNLVGNAIKFTHEGEVAVKVQVAAETPADWLLHFIVTDTGIGIPDEQQKKIFDPFSQADSSTTRKYGGTGLGLTISMRLVAMMDGKIWLNSKEGQGTAFHFIVRMDAANESALHTVVKASMVEPVSGGSQDQPTSPAGSLRVLLAEDNVVNQRLTRRLLEKRGHHVTVTANGRRAVEALEKDSFDLVLMDVQMPELDGFEATALIREREKHSGTHVPVVALTAHAMKGDRERCLAAGMDGYLTKPIRSSELDEILKGVVPNGMEFAVPALKTET